MELQKVRLGDVCDIYAGGDAPKDAVNCKNNDCIIPIFSNGVDNEGLYGFTSEAKINKPSVTISARGTIGVPFLRKEPYFPIVRLLSLIPKGNQIDLYYLYYATKMLKFKKDGSVQQQLTVPMLADVVLRVPEMLLQKKIAAVLSALDDKIALNKKMNQKLEAMAKRLYDYWFVQFDFPDENGRPYKTSGGPMTYNETLNREIPAGWDVCGFSDFGTFKNGINYDKEELGDQTVKIVNVRNISESTTYFNIDELDDITLKTESLERFVTTSSDILLARSGSPGATRLLPQTDKKVIYCGFIIRYQLDEKELDKQLYLFHVLKNYEQVTALQSAGSILKNISQDTLNALTVLNPSPRILDEFNSKIKPVYDMLSKNICELNKLTALRDKLLPLLMNGQVEVK